MTAVPYGDPDLVTMHDINGPNGIDHEFYLNSERGIAMDTESGSRHQYSTYDVPTQPLEAV